MGQAAYQYAISAVREACAITRGIQRELIAGHVLHKDDRSPVTVADFAAQAIIAQRLYQRDHKLVLVGEESSAMLRNAERADLRRMLVERLRPHWPDVREDDVIGAIDIGTQAPDRSFWTLDPIDGTKGFMRNGQYAISLAFIVDGLVRFGVLGCPNLSADFERPFDDPDPHGLIVYAARGEGCWSLNASDVRAEVSRVIYRAADDGAFRICGSAASGHSDQQAAARVIAALGGANKQHLDSQAKYAVVARGQADAYLRIPVSSTDREYIWDHAPGRRLSPPKPEHW
ncbi:MAG: inositol monophosphatase family protein [Gammaproteobacteria bacterium]